MAHSLVSTYKAISKPGHEKFSFLGVIKWSYELQRASRFIYNKLKSTSICYKTKAPMCEEWRHPVRGSYFFGFC